MSRREQTNADVERGRTCYAERRWADAFEALLRAESTAPLDRADLDRLVWSAALIGDDDAFVSALERLYSVCDDSGDARAAARAAFWIGFRLADLGASARASGWLSRARRHIEGDDDCAERGYLLLPTLFGLLGDGDLEEAERAASEVEAIGTRHGEADLIALARNLRGRALLRQGRMETGLALLDEVLVALVSGELSPLVTGLVYCNGIATCQQVYAFDRAREWTAELTRWCESQPQLVTFTGACLVHRSEILQLGGDWSGALDQVRQLGERECKDADPEVLGDACYQQGELFRLRGALTDAEAAYQQARNNGRDPQPGLALLRLAQGREREAAHAIDRVLSTTTATWRRARVLPAFFEIMLATGAIDRARAAAEELTVIARELGTEILGAMAAHARGALLLAEDDPTEAIEPLRHAFGVWHRVGAPYLTARIRVQLARAYRALGDEDGAALELDSARAIFEELGAAPDLAALAEDEPTSPAPAHGLSPRELEVLQLVAQGKTNKRIAAELCVSERTVERHVSNIFTKIDVGSRAAATAFAYEHGLA